MSSPLSPSLPPSLPPSCSHDAYRASASFRPARKERHRDPFVCFCRARYISSGAFFCPSAGDCCVRVFAKFACVSASQHIDWSACLVWRAKLCCFVVAVPFSCCSFFVIPFLSLFGCPPRPISWLWDNRRRLSMLRKSSRRSWPTLTKRSRRGVLALDPSGLGVAMLYVGRRRRVGTFNPPFRNCGRKCSCCTYVSIRTGLERLVSPHGAIYSEEGAHPDFLAWITGPPPPPDHHIYWCFASG